MDVWEKHVWHSDQPPRLRNEGRLKKEVKRVKLGVDFRVV